MVLSDVDIVKEINRGSLSISPWSPPNLGPASYDLCLGCEFIAPDAVWRTLDVTSQVDVTSSYKRKTYEEPVIPSGGMLLGSTIEEVRLPPNLVGILHGRSSLGRLGLCVHITAGLIDPGFQGRITLELVNHSPYDLRLKVGMRIAQLAFHRLETPAAKPYSGKYQGDQSVQLSLLSKDWE